MEVHELKEFLDVKFEMNDKILDEKFTNMELQLKTIVEQTTKTNGRVTKLEHKMEESEKFSEFHILKCPVKKELDEYKEKLNSDLLFFTFMRRYPKVSFIMGVILIALIVAGGVDEAMILLTKIFGGS